jgi:pilus assembly protein CpaC
MKNTVNSKMPGTVVRVLSLLLVALVVVTISARAEKTIQVNLGEAIVLGFDGYGKAAVADPTIADVAPLSDRELSVIGKKAGVTTLTVVGKSDQTTVIHRIEVVNETVIHTIAKMIGRPNITVKTVGESIMLEGQATDEIEAQRILQIVTAFKMPVVNLMEIEKPRQIRIRTKVAEVSSDAVKGIGFKWFGPQGDMQFAVNWNNKTGWLMGTVQPQSSSGSAPLDPIKSQVSGDVMLQLLESKGYAKLLAEPTLVTYSGQEASFLVGQEIPIVQQLPQSFNVQYKEVGVRMKIKPTADSKNRINTKIHSEVSQVVGTEQRFGTPIIGSKKADSTLQVEDGQTIVIGGLLENNIDRDVLRKVPWMADIPILGLLFRHKSQQKSQREVVFFMTPEVIKDIDATTKDATQTPIMQGWTQGFNPKDVLVVPAAKDDWSLANPGRMGWPKSEKPAAPKAQSAPDTAVPKEADTNSGPAQP